MIIEKIYQTNDQEKHIMCWNEGLIGACRGGHLHIAQLMIHKGATCWNSGLLEAVRENHVVLVKLMIDKGAEISKYYWFPQAETEILNLLGHGIQLEKFKFVLNIEILANKIHKFRAEFSKEFILHAPSDLVKLTVLYSLY